MSSDSQEAFIYVIGTREGPAFKVGWSADPVSRLSNIQVGHPEVMVIHYQEALEASKAPVIEKLIHRQLAHTRIRGEWFLMPLDQLIDEVRWAVIRWDGEPNLVFRFQRRLL